MAEYTLQKMLGGAGNGLDAPSWWEGNEGFLKFSATEDPQRYILRPYFHGNDLFKVWVVDSVPQDAFIELMFFHRECFRGSLVDAQKELLNIAFSSAKEYTNIIMIGGYAALFTMLAQGKGFTTATSLVAAIFLALSLLCFIGLEVFGMILRSRSNLGLARAVDDPQMFEQHIANYRAGMAATQRRFMRTHIFFMYAAVATALVSFAIMLIALLHGLWLEFLKDSIASIG